MLLWLLWYKLLGVAAAGGLLAGVHRVTQRTGAAVTVPVTMEGQALADLSWSSSYRCTMAWILFASVYLQGAAAC